MAGNSTASDTPAWARMSEDSSSRPYASGS